MKTTQPSDSHHYDASYFQGNNQAGDRPALHWYSRVVNRLTKGDTPKPRVFEFGCGVGWLLKHLSNRNEVAGFDISEYCRAQSAERVKEAEIFSDMSAVLASTFDGVVALHVLEHIDDPLPPLESFARILKPGGFLLFVVPVTDGLGHRLKGERWMGYRDPTHVSLMKSSEWVALCRAAGFSIEGIHGDGLWDPPYFPLLPRALQLALCGAPAAFQVYLGGGKLFLPVSWSEDLIMICRLPS